ncbi:TIGR03085 family metal-binding protein [Actinomycetota bacterium]
MTHLARLERIGLCDTLERVGPDAPTLCEGWNTADLAAHLVIRERRPDAAAGVLLAPLASHTERVQDGYAAKPWHDLVDLVRGGPPTLSPTRVPAVDDVVNLAEFYVHHEDVLRAQEGWRPRPTSPALQKALWATLGRMASPMFRAAPVGVVLIAPEGRTSPRRPSPGHGTVIMRGEPGELLLAAFGRLPVADVRLEGESADVEALRSARLGL